MVRPQWKLVRLISSFRSRDNRYIHTYLHIYHFSCHLSFLLYFISYSHFSPFLIRSSVSLLYLSSLLFSSLQQPPPSRGSLSLSFSPVFKFQAFVFLFHLGVLLFWQFSSFINWNNCHVVCFLGSVTST